MADKSLTGRQLIHQILNSTDIDVPILAMNINSGDDEFNDESAPNSQEIVSVADSSEGSGAIILYYLGDTPPPDEE